jgi:hypothetical protein
MRTSRELISTRALAELLERNGYPGAAEKIAAGAPRKKALAYIAGRAPYHDDGEGHWLQQYIDSLNPWHARVRRLRPRLHIPQPLTASRRPKQPNPEDR